MAGHVNTEPSGPGELYLFYDNQTVFGDWERIRASVNPATAFRTFGHLEASGASRPGDAPVVWGLGQSPILPGSSTALGIYDRTAVTGERAGAGWDAPDGVVTAPGAEAPLPEGWRWQVVGGRRIAVGGADYATAEEAEAAGVEFTPPEDDFTLWGAIKGTSRWLWLAFETLPEGIDALGRAVGYIKDGTLTPQEALAGMTQGSPVAGLAGMLSGIGMTDEQIDRAGELVGIPFFQYVRAAMEGERLNMGQGLFAGGDIPEDIATQLQMYDNQTHGEVVDVKEATGFLGALPGDFGSEEIRAGGLSEADFQREQARAGGKLLVEGAGGKTYEAKTLEEWKFLRDNVGRAALLSSLQGTSLEQRALGTPFAAQQEWIFDENAVTRDKSSGRYFAHSFGRTPASLISDPGDTVFKYVSGSLDLTKQLIDLPIAKVGKTIVSGANRFIGLTDEAADLADGTSTLVRMVEGADAPGRMGAMNDLYRGRIDLDRATNALSRWGDDNLSAARTTHQVLWDTAERAAEARGIAGPIQVDRLIPRAARNAASRRILEDTLAQAGTVDDVTGAVDNLLAVQAREGVDLTKGLYGSAQASDEVVAQSRQAAERLASLLADRKASVVFDPVTGKQMLTFDADITRAQNTVKSLRGAVTETLTARQTAARRYSDAVRAYQDQSSRLSKLAPRGQTGGDVAAMVAPKLRRLHDDVLTAAADPTLRGVVDEAGVVLDGRKLESWRSMDIAEETERTARQLSGGLFTDNWTMKRRATRFLGDTDEMAEEVDNLARVLRRSDGDGILVNAASSVRPRLDQSRLTDFLTGGGKAKALSEQIIAAKTHDEIQAILRPTVEHSGQIPAAFVDMLAKASDEAEVVDAFIRYGAGQAVLPPRMALLGGAARFGTVTTTGGLGIGAVAGAIEEQQAGGDFGDILGGAIGGAVIGAMAGSAIGGVGGFAAGKATRSIEDVADAMDLLLAGSRSTVTSILTGAGMDMGRAQAGLSIPTQLSYAFGHSPVGRRFARSASVNMNLNDPNDFYWKLSDYAKSLGLRLNDEVHIYQRGAGAAAKREKVLVSRLDPEEAAQQVLELEAQGFSLARTVTMDDVLSRASQLQPNNPARSHEVLTRFGAVADAVLASKGMDDARIDLLTAVFKQGAQAFLGTTNAAGTPIAYALRAKLGDEILDFDDHFKLDSELWSGHIDLPDPVRVQRAINQLDAVGRTVQLFTGAGVWGPRKGQIIKNLKRMGEGAGWQRITPDLERNMAVRMARVFTSTVWGPVILLGRAGSFVTKVLGEDQFRMAASSIPSIITHPANYISAIAANWSLFRNLPIKTFRANYGVTARADLARVLPSKPEYDEAGNLITDFLDDLGHYGVGEKARHALSFYDRDAVKGRTAQIYGSKAWVPINRGEPGPTYVNAVAHEFRQLVHSPIVRYMARSTADDPVADTVRWLKETKEGQAVGRDWARQFKTDADVQRYMGEDVLEAFLHDEWARLHLKTGGDWVYVVDKSAVMDSAGNLVHPRVLKEQGWENLTPGYHVYRKGDEELLDVVRKGELKVRSETLDKKGKRVFDDEGNVVYVEREVRVHDTLNEEKWDAIRDLISRKHRQFEDRVHTGSWDARTSHRLPAIVKGPRTTEVEIGRAGISSVWEELIDVMFDFVLARPSRVLSRQPTFGAFFWERMGMMMPSMSDDMRTIALALADEEGAGRTVRNIAREWQNTGGPVSRNSLDNWEAIDFNAKAYAVERTKDTLFDLHRQRNFIDGIRLIFPFAGPFVEALEAWGRVVKRNPLRVWRRGTQMVAHTWNTSGIGDDPDPFGQGWFYTDPKTGEERFEYPFLGSMFPSLMRAATDNEVSSTDLEARARGLNVVFGPDDLSQGEGPEFMGFPLQAFNPGVGPVLNVAVPLFWQDRTGASRELFEYFFPYGEPESFTAAVLPYNLRKMWEGVSGLIFKSKGQQLVSNSMDQLSRMTANGEVGDGPNFRYDLSAPGGVQEAQEEARRRASWQAIFEGVARTLLPSLITPEVTAELEVDPRFRDFPAEALSTTEALGNYARELMTPEGAVWYETEDGYRVSTEGDWDVTTEYLNDMFGKDMFNAEFLSLPLTDRAYPRAYIKEGYDWVVNHSGLVDALESTATLLMPDYAAAKALEDEPGEYSFEAFDLAVERGDASFYTFDEQTSQIESRLLKMRKRQIALEADRIFGSDDQIENDDARKDQKDRWMDMHNQDAASMFESGDITEAQVDTVRAELLGWDRPELDWENQGLVPEELITVDAVLWYIDLRDRAEMLLANYNIDSISHKGDSDEQKAMARAVRQDVRKAVQAQFDHSIRTGAPMGNFRYIYTEYLEPELLEDEEEFDAFAALAELRRGDMGFEDLDAPFSPIAPGPLGVGVDYSPGVAGSYTVTSQRAGG